MPDRDWPKVCLLASSLEANVGLCVVTGVCLLGLGVVTGTSGVLGSGVLTLVLGVLGGAGWGASVGLGLILILCLCFGSTAGDGRLTWLGLGSGLLSGTLELSTLHKKHLNRIMTIMNEKSFIKEEIKF